MKRKIVTLVLAAILAVSSVLAVGAAGGWFTGAWKEAPDQSGVVKYEKPAIGELTQEGAYPEEIQSEISNADWEKEWYEYIVYNKTPLHIIQDGNKRLVGYDPYDYNYGMIMEVTGTAYNGILDEEGFTTANEMSVSYTTSSSSAWSHGWSVDLGFEEVVKVKAPLIAEGQMKFSQNLGYNGSLSGSNDTSTSKTATYNAIYLNSNGTPYRWRVVKYAVYMPIYCEYQELKNGQWIVTDTNYLLLTTVQGTCREWIEDGVAYYEDWKTGDPITVEDFWEEYLTEDALLYVYCMKERLFPEWIIPYLPPVKDIED